MSASGGRAPHPAAPRPGQGAARLPNQATRGARTRTIVAPLAVILVARVKHEHAPAVASVVGPLAVVNCLGRPNVLAAAVPLRIAPVAFVHSTVAVCVRPLLARLCVRTRSRRVIAGVPART